MRKRYDGDAHGCHSVSEPPNSLPLTASRLSNNPVVQGHEILLEVTGLVLSDQVFNHLYGQANGVVEVLGLLVSSIVDNFGKFQDPDTGYGGNLIGTVRGIGKALDATGLAVGDQVVSWISSAAIPLQVQVVVDGNPLKRLIRMRGTALVSEAASLVRIPPTWAPEDVAAVLQVAGGAAVIRRVAQPGDRVLVLGGGLAGVLAAFSSSELVGQAGSVVLVDPDPDRCALLRNAQVPVNVVLVDTLHAQSVLQGVMEIMAGHYFDLAIDCTAGYEASLAAAYVTRPCGTVIIHNLCAKLGVLALGIDSLSKDLAVRLAAGTGPESGEFALALLNRNPVLRELMALQ